MIIYENVGEMWRYYPTTTLEGLRKATKQLKKRQLIHV
jgi:hypothetical protein